MPFFHYHQNNSGGSFRAPALNVIVEARDAGDADSRAEDLGVYFNGCNDGRDCPCCGDRWSAAWDEDGDEVPSLYDEPVDKYLESDWAGSWEKPGLPEVLVYRLDGTREVHYAREANDPAS